MYCFKYLFLFLIPIYYIYIYMYLDLCFPRMGKTSYSCGNNSGVSVCSKSTIQGADMAVSDTRYLFFDHLMLSVVGEASEGLEICRGGSLQEIKEVCTPVHRFLQRGYPTIQEQQQHKKIPIILFFW